MKNKLIILGLLLVLVFSFGCTTNRAIVHSPSVGEIETNEFDKTLIISENEELEFGGTYGVIKKTDSVQVSNAVHTSTFSGLTIGNSANFLQTKWTLTKLDCENSLVGLVKADDSLDLQKGARYGDWVIDITCTPAGTLTSIQLELDGTFVATDLDVLFVPNEDFGYPIQYVGEGGFKLR